MFISREKPRRNSLVEILQGPQPPVKPEPIDLMPEEHLKKALREMSEINLVNALIANAGLISAHSRQVLACALTHHGKVEK